MCFCFAGHYSMQLYRKVMEDIKNGDASQMADLHAISSGLKAVCSFQASQGAEQCRLSCGGHGYSLASGLPKIYTTLTAGCTYEGDNLVMLLQLARYLMKCAKEVRSGEQPANEGALVQYLYAKENGRSEFNTGSSKEKQWLEIQKAFEHTSCRITMKTFDRFSGYCRKGDERQIAWNKTSIELAKAARCHTRTFLSRNFIRTVLNEENGQIREVLGDLLQLYLHYELLECRADLLEVIIEE
jgi:acyl-CoA oxidase